MLGYKKGLPIESADVYAKQALSRCRSGVHSGCFRHDVQILIINNLKDILPLWVMIFVVGKVTAGDVAARKRKFGEV